MRLTERLEIRLSKDDLARIQNAIQHDGRSTVSSFVRKAALEKCAAQEKTGAWLTRSLQESDLFGDGALVDTSKVKRRYLLGKMRDSTLTHYLDEVKGTWEPIPLKYRPTD